MRLTVNDGNSADQDTLTVTSVNTAPVANAGSNTAGTVGQSAQLNGNSSFDANGEVTKIALKVESGLLNIDRYLPPPGEAKARPARSRPEGARRERPARQRGDLVRRPLARGPGGAGPRGIGAVRPRPALPGA